MSMDSRSWLRKWCRKNGLDLTLEYGYDYDDTISLHFLFLT